jgi:5-methylcytosine-specific restriction endonuclease McrA
LARFAKGQQSWNKGTKGLMKPNSGSFQKGMIALNKKEHIKKICLTCGKEFNVKPSLDKSIYCSRACVLKGKPSRNLGKKASDETRLKQRMAKLGNGGSTHWNYKHGKSKEINKHYCSSDYKNWRRSVFIRDEYTCKHCGESHVHIHAHHIVPLVEDISKIYDINNGMTLCVNCHSEVHGRRIA